MTSELPRAAELVVAALNVLKSNPDVLPCNRLAVSTNVFVNMNNTAGSLSSMFPPKTKLQHGKGGGTRAPAQFSNVKRAKLLHSAPPETPTSCQPSGSCGAAMPTAMHVDTCTVSNGATSDRPKGKRSLLQLVQPQGAVQGKVDVPEGPTNDQADNAAGEHGVESECHSRITRAEKSNGIIIEGIGGTSGWERASTPHDGFDCRWAGPRSQPTRCHSAAAVVTEVQQRWQAGLSDHVPAHHCCSSVDRGMRGPFKADPAQSHGDALTSQSVVGNSAGRHCAGVCVAHNICRSVDNHEGIDVAEQRRIYHLIQMQAREQRQGGLLSSASVLHRAAQPAARQMHKPARKQASIISLLNKK